MIFWTKVVARKLSDKLIKTLSTPKAGAKKFYDAEVAGFGIKITSNGVRSFILNYRIDGRERRYTIGRMPDWNSESARNEAIALRKAISLGQDPLEMRLKKRTAETINDLCAEYLERHAYPHKRPASIRRDEELINRVIKPKLGKNKVAIIKRRDIEILHQSLMKTPYSANRLLALLSKMFSLAVQWEIVDKNPCKGIKRFHEDRRERFLIDDELRRLLEALRNYPRQHANGKSDEARIQSANIIRLLLLTGARKGEILGMRWDQLDLTKGVWTKPSSHTKQKKAHRVPLSAPARQLLAGIKGNGEYVFPGDDGGPQQDVKKAWLAICKAADISNVRLHDLRHTYAAQLASAGLSLPVIGALLGHTQPGTTARYSHLLDDPLRQATERIGKIMELAENEAATK